MTKRPMCPVQGCDETVTDEGVLLPYFCLRHWMLVQYGEAVSVTARESWRACSAPSRALVERIAREMAAFERVHVCDWETATRMFLCGKDGGITLTCNVCRRTIEPRPCGITGCEGRGMRLCDYPVGRGRSRRTCDLALCDHHATAAGPDVDFCPAHAVAIGREAKAATELRR